MLITCKDCQQDLPKASFAKSQLKKDPSNRRCKVCAEKILLLESSPAQDTLNNISATNDSNTNDDDKNTSTPNNHNVKESMTSTIVNGEIETTETMPVTTVVEEVDGATNGLFPTMNDVPSDNVESTFTTTDENEETKIQTQQEEIVEEPKIEQDLSNSTINEIQTETDTKVDNPTSTADTASVTIATDENSNVGEENNDKNNIVTTIITDNEVTEKDITVEDNKQQTTTNTTQDNVDSNNNNDQTQPKTNQSLQVNVENSQQEPQQQKEKIIKNSSHNRNTSDDDRPINTTTTNTTTAAKPNKIPTPPVSSSPHSKRIQLAICAMDKKARSKPMAQILSRLDESLIEVIFFGDKIILNSPVEEWPICDVLIAFYSNGFPLAKAEEYAALRKPYVINDLKMQRVLMDRRRVYDLLEASGIDVPRHVYMSRDGYVSSNANVVNGGGNGEDDLIEHDDHIEVNGVTINKPFVEKPIDADDHNIAIYYPSSAGGGCKKLFRKIGDRSSEFYPDINEVRRDGSFIYEEFIETQGTDVKMYTVGPDYGHAEARKSPTVDGKVSRNPDGKEVRFPVILTLREKEIARRIVVVFKQQVCGFDLLRVQEGDSLISYVCDVNGFSFVKNSRKYYDDCAQILTEHMLAAVKPKQLKGLSALYPLLKTIQDKDSDTETPRKRRSKSSLFEFAKSKLQGEYKRSSSSGEEVKQSAATLEEGAVPVREIPDMLVNDPAAISASGTATSDNASQSKTAPKAPCTHQEELRCVIAVVRHGDRTPKQKLKVNLSEPQILKYFHRHTDNCKKDLKIKAKQPMTEFLETVKQIIDEKRANPEVKIGDEILMKFKHMRDVLERWKIGGLNRKLQLKPRKWEEYEDQHGEKTVKCIEIQLILKWGGNLTKLGEKQSITLGQRLRHSMYPNTPGGGGILRLHSTFRHDLKIKTSDEGRVMKTAAAFAKGLLELEGEITPILISLVHKEKDSLHMLDPSGNKEVKRELEQCKLNINQNLQRDFDVDAISENELENLVGPKLLTSIHKALLAVKNPRKCLFIIWHTMGDLLEQLDDMLGQLPSDLENKNEGGEGLQGDDEDDEALSGIKLYKGETLLELTERWRILHDKLYDEEKDVFDLSRVPDVHDNVRFDMLHNPHLGLSTTLEKLYIHAKLMADCVVPQEYGMSIEDKRSIGNKMCHALLEKIKYDLIIARTDNQVDMRYMINMDYSADLPINTMGRRIRTRLYFTSESHLHTLLNILRFPSSQDESHKSRILSKRGIDIIAAAPELCYLTQVIIRLFENTKKDPDDPKRFRIEILFSPGATATPMHMSELDRDLDNSRIDTEELLVISKENLTCKEVEDYFSQSIKEGESNDDEDIISIVSTVDENKQNELLPVGNGNDSTPHTRLDEVKENPEEENTEEENTVSNEEENILDVADNNKDEHVDISEGPSEAKDDDTMVHGSSTVKVSSRARGSFDIDNVEANEDIYDYDDDEDRVEKMAKVLARQYFWTSVAAVSFVLGIGCIFLSKSIQEDFKTRRWSRR